MDAARYQQIKGIVMSLLDLPDDQREQAFDRACGEDAELRAAVRMQLSEQLAETGPRFDARIAEAAGIAFAQSLLPATLTLLRVLGRGGMGTVFLAERQSADVRHPVAVKLLRADGEWNPAVTARFRAECGLLAELEHPNIAHFIEFGTGAQGSPYLLMEYVDGAPIDAWVRQRGGSVEERLRLFLKVCAAVQHAHGHLVVHCDLKPANILVNAQGEPKLLDFGIAKILPLTGAATLTRPEQRVLTYRYASPEQILGQPVSTASDVYALGLVLHRLLSDASPYRDSARSDPELARAICEEPAIAPSAALRRDPLGTTRPVAAASLRRHLRGDVDAIVLKALRKEPAQRYGSAEALAEDIRRFLRGEPVLARKGSRIYRLGKFARRNRGALASVVVVLGLLVAGGYQRELRLRDTEIERQKAQGTMDFLADLVESAHPNRTGGKNLTVREALDKLADDPERMAGLDPAAQVSVLTAIGRLQRIFALFDAADRNLQRAEQLSRSITDPAARLNAVLEIGALRTEQSRYREALEFVGSAHALARADADRPGAAVLRTGNTLVTTRAMSGDYAGARTLAEQLLAEFPGVRSDATEARALTNIRSDLGRIYYMTSRYDLAEPIFRELAEGIDAGSDREPISTASRQLALAQTLQRRGKLEEADRWYRTSTEAMERLLGPQHPRVLSHRTQAISLLIERGDYAAAEVHYRTFVDRADERLQADDSRVGWLRIEFARALRAAGRFDEAEASAREAIAAFAHSEDPNGLSASRALLAMILVDTGRLDAAMELVDQALAQMAPATIPDSVNAKELAATRALAALHRGSTEYGTAPIEDCWQALHELLRDGAAADFRLASWSMVLSEVLLTPDRRERPRDLAALAAATLAANLPETNWHRRYAEALLAALAPADGSSPDAPDAAAAAAVQLLGERYGRAHPRTRWLDRVLVRAPLATSPPPGAVATH